MTSCRCKHFFLAIVVIQALLASSCLWASTAAIGTFTAEQACDVYVSKNRRSNPDNHTLTVGVRYTIFEVNRADKPDWYRVRVENARPPERWVSAQCGSAKVEMGTAKNEVAVGARCTTPGLGDSFKLALSWHPAFCETKPSKPECRSDDTQSYQANHFTLHGLWPNQGSCGINYAYCGQVKHQPSNMCEYPASSLSALVLQSLSEVMPSAAVGSCLERHEWHKHGTCQGTWTADDYFNLSVNLTRQFNGAGVAEFMRQRIGKTVSEAEFLQQLDTSLGSGAGQRVQIKCVDGNLVDVYVNLPKSIAANDDLRGLISRADPGFQSNCDGHFRIDRIGVGK